MLLTVLNSPLRVYWSWSRTLTLCTAIGSYSFSASACHLLKDICAFADGIPSLNLNFLSCFTVLLNNMFLINSLGQWKECSSGWSSNPTSHCLGECPNHLDHQLYMLLTVLNSLLRAYWSWSRTLTLWPAICSDSFSTSAHHLLEDICAFAIGIPSLKLIYLSCFTVLLNNIHIIFTVLLNIMHII